MARTYHRTKPFIFTKARKDSFKKAVKVHDKMFEMGREAYYKKYGKN